MLCHGSRQSLGLLVLLLVSCSYRIDCFPSGVKGDSHQQLPSTDDQDNADSSVTKGLSCNNPDGSMRGTDLENDSPDYSDSATNSDVTSFTGQPTGPVTASSGQSATPISTSLGQSAVTGSTSPGQSAATGSTSPGQSAATGSASSAQSAATGSALAGQTGSSVTRQSVDVSGPNEDAFVASDDTYNSLGSLQDNNQLQDNGENATTEQDDSTGGSNDYVAELDVVVVQNQPDDNQDSDGSDNHASDADSKDYSGVKGQQKPASNDWA